MIAATPNIVETAKRIVVHGLFPDESRPQFDSNEGRGEETNRQIQTQKIEGQLQARRKIA